MGRLSRRALLCRTGVLGSALATGTVMPRHDSPSASAATRLSVLAPLPPDPAPPGVAAFAEEELAAWERGHDVDVRYEAVRWPDLRDEIAFGFDGEDGAFDVAYMSSWVPEFSQFLAPLEDRLPVDLRRDLPASCFNAVSWDGSVFGVPYTLSLLTLFYNRGHFEAAGLNRPPATWDELKGYAQELTRGDEQYGWVLNYGAPRGIGGTASYWMAFLQQAGGTMYDDDGMPAFNDESGIDALQFMIDLMPATAPSSLTGTGIIDATAVLKSGRASMMMNWPFMWKDAQDPTMSQLTGKLACAVLPAGAAGTATIDGSDAWSIAASSENPDLALELIEFYLAPEVQKRQVLDAGWLPIRLSILADPEVQQAATNAAVVLEQARHPYNSFVTPDYDAVTHALGMEIQRALAGEKTAAEALNDGSAAVEALVLTRLSR
ncbi:MAG: multiple sugar transport system substrate-binding protein [Thermomicrobiales bacterium]|nr:multiple sugar transport system substrate-binding protein [Thermomicrobiales bacterium]